MEGMKQAKKDLQVTEELGLLSDAVEDIGDKVDTLEGRLQKVMINSPTAGSESKQEVPVLCDVAKQIYDAKCGARKVHRVLNYILDNLQL